MAGQPQPDPVRFRTGWLTAGTVLTVLAITIGPLTAGSWLARQTETQYQTYPHPGTRVELELNGLNVQVLPGKDDEIAIERRLTWSLAKPALDERWDGQILRTSVAPCPPIAVGPRCAVNYTLRVPPRSTVAATIRSGDLTVRELSGDLDLSATDGDITATDIRSSQVSIRTTSGDVDLLLTTEPHTVEAITSNGDITIGVPRHTGYNLTVDADEPDIDVPHHPASPHTITARSSTGKVRIRPST